VRVGDKGSQVQILSARPYAGTFQKWGVPVSRLGSVRGRLRGIYRRSIPLLQAWFEGRGVTDGVCSSCSGRCRGLSSRRRAVGQDTALRYPGGHSGPRPRPRVGAEGGSTAPEFCEGFVSCRATDYLTRNLRSSVSRSWQSMSLMSDRSR
jgi:hypothetical protein